MDKKVAIQLHHNDEWREVLKIAAESGFKYIAMAFTSQTFRNENGDWLYSGRKFFEEDGWEKEIDEIGEACAKNGIKCVQTHAPYYNLWIDPETSYERAEIAMMRCMKATAMLGAELCAVHPKGIMRNEEGMAERNLQGNLKHFTPFAEELEKHGCLLGIENLPWDQYCRDPKDHVQLIDAFQSKSVCAVWDFGHSHLVDYDKVEAIRKLGKRIKGTHVHGNWATHGLDYHMPPLLGTNDWDGTLGALKEQDYAGYLTLEVDTELKNALPSFMKYLYDSVCILWDKFQK